MTTREDMIPSRRKFNSNSGSFALGESHTHTHTRTRTYKLIRAAVAIRAVEADNINRLEPQSWTDQRRMMTEKNTFNTQDLANVNTAEGQ